MLFTIYSVCKDKNTHKFFIFLHDNCKISWRNPGGISQAFLQEILCFTMKLIDFALTSNLSLAFLQEISPGNFFFLHEILNFTLRQFLHETRNMCFYLYKHCNYIYRKIFLFVWVDALRPG